MEKLCCQGKTLVLKQNSSFEFSKKILFKAKLPVFVKTASFQFSWKTWKLEFWVQNSSFGLAESTHVFLRFWKLPVFSKTSSFVLALFLQVFIFKWKFEFCFENSSFGQAESFELFQRFEKSSLEWKLEF